MIEYTVKVLDSGTRYWILNGKFHREDGPAVERVDGRNHWYLNGEPHREDGPAIEWANGTKEWWLNGEIVTLLEPIFIAHHLAVSAVNNTTAYQKAFGKYIETVKVEWEE